MDDFSVRLDPASEAELTRGIRGFPRELQKATRRRLRDAARPIGERVIREGATELPHGGGLAGRVAGSRITVSTTTGTRTAGVRLRLRTLPNEKGQSYDLAGMDRGVIRHPYWGRWVAGAKPQSIRAGVFTGPFERGHAQARAAVETALLDAAKTVRVGEAHR